MATALGIAAVRAGKSVYRCTLAELIEGLARAEREGRLVEKSRFYSRASLLIIDEIGYLPIGTAAGCGVPAAPHVGGANLFFQLVNARYEKSAMILTSSRGFAARRSLLTASPSELGQRPPGLCRGDLFGDPVVATALLDAPGSPRSELRGVAASSTTPSSSRSRGPATASARTPISFPSTPAPTPPLRHHRHPNGEADHLTKGAAIKEPTEHRHHQSGTFSVGTSETFSVGSYKTGIGPISVRWPKLRDRGDGTGGKRIRFTSQLLPPFLRRTKNVEELLPLQRLLALSPLEIG